VLQQLCNNCASLAGLVLCFIACFILLCISVTVSVCVCVKCKEDEVMARIRDAEHSQLVEDMRRRVAELEIEVRQHYTC